jgi:hypothetical protein
MDFTITVVVPVYNGGESLGACLEYIGKLSPPPDECVIVDDGSRDESRAMARRAGFKVISTGGRRGPAVARNLGARAASGDIVLFLDADVLVSSDAVARIRAHFEGDPSLDGVSGSYDDQPGSPSFVSQYRNLLHCFIHQTSRPDTCTLWSACGAIRRQVFLEHGGFRESYHKPCVEDIDLGFRLHAAGRKLLLDKQLQVKHVKHWSLWRMVKTDLLDRAVPWTQLILRQRSMPADLNLRWENRISVLVVCAGAAAAALQAASVVATGEAALDWLYLAGGGALAALLVGVLNLDFYRFLRKRRGFWFALRSFPMHCLHFLTSGLGFALGVALYPFRKQPKDQCSPAAPEPVQAGGLPLGGRTAQFQGRSSAISK